MTKRLRFVDKYLTVWIFLAMLIGVGIGYFLPHIGALNESLSVGSVNIPIAIGLILMMYPPLAKVDYNLLFKAFEEPKVLLLSLFLNWVVGPALMFGLAVAFVGNEPTFFSGLILIGIARCIAMVIVWNDLAGGNREYAALLVALNSLFQVFMYSVYAWFWISFLPSWIGLTSFQVSIPMKEIVKGVLLYLGIPFLAGFLSRYYLVKSKGLTWYQTVFVPKISPITLYALLFTIVWMFSLKGSSILSLPMEVMKVAFPLTMYFMVMFFMSFFLNKLLGVEYDKNAAIAFTASGNNFELAIAVAISTFGLSSNQAFAGVIGPLVEVPVLIILVKVSLWLKKRYYG